jgi:predicted transcriptional regulator
VDFDRLNRQMKAVYRVMADQNWHTLDEIERATGHPQASVSARLRDLRKPKFGGFTVEKRRGGAGGTWEYRLLARRLHADV